MHAADEIHHLRDTKIGRRAEIGVGEVLVHSPASAEQGDRLPHALADRFVEIGVQARWNQVVSRLREGTREFPECRQRGRPRDDLQSERRPQGSLHRGERHLTVPLGEVRVSHVHVRAGDPHRKVQRRSRGEQGDVDVPAVRSRRDRVGPLGSAHGDPHDAEEWLERERHGSFAAFDGRQPAVRDAVALDHVGEHGYGLGPPREFAGQRAPAMAVGDDAVRHPRHGVGHVHGDQIARLRPLDRDWTAHHVRAVRRAALHLPRDRDSVLQHAGLADAVPAEVGDGVAALVVQDSLVADRVERDGRSGGDGEDGIVVSRGQPSPQHRARPGGEVVLSGHRPGARLQDKPSGRVAGHPPITAWAEISSLRLPPTRWLTPT